MSDFRRPKASPTEDCQLLIGSAVLHMIAAFGHQLREWVPPSHRIAQQPLPTYLQTNYAKYTRTISCIVGLTFGDEAGDGLTMFPFGNSVLFATQRTTSSAIPSLSHKGIRHLRLGCRSVPSKHDFCQILLLRQAANFGVLSHLWRTTGLSGPTRTARRPRQRFRLWADASSGCVDSCTFPTLFSCCRAVESVLQAWSSGTTTVCQLARARVPSVPSSQPRLRLASSRRRSTTCRQPMWPGWAERGHR